MEREKWRQREMKREHYGIMALLSVLFRWAGEEQLTGAGDTEKGRAFLCQCGLEVGSVSHSLMHCQIMEIPPQERMQDMCLPAPPSHNFLRRRREQCLFSSILPSFSLLFLSPSLYHSMWPLVNDMYGHCEENHLWIGKSRYTVCL